MTKTFEDKLYEGYIMFPHDKFIRNLYSEYIYWRKFRNFTEEESKICTLLDEGIITLDDLKIDYNKTRDSVWEGER